MLVTTLVRDLVAEQFIRRASELSVPWVRARLIITTVLIP